MPVPPHRRSPTIRRRRLSRELRKLREESGLTAEQVWRRLEWSAGKLSRIEHNDWRRPNPRDVKDLLDLYGITDESRREALITLARESRERGWWETEFGDVLGGDYAGFEAEAERIHSYEPLVICGLLQTAAYARAAIRGDMIRDPEEVERRVALRMKRQAILTGPNPPTLWAIMDEAALHRPFGTPEERIEQLERLIATGDSDHITVQVIPFSVGMHPGLACGFALLDYADPDESSIAYVEMGGNALYLERAEDLKSHSLRFQHLQAAALSKDATTAFLKRLRDDLK
ncbi:helix-turn-helix domain-containing protein [Thermomonospora cellulosilytica]|uniref:Transcriptional regulator with XRE-family HTH domain n=1 Tax=Thermomonospora cellulosilytica TaxID=1411118 RepID=A0A7W3R734_9ACTN|nr:helix-turn-helix transcriptional regulator [Thermomonospora cellulosilytica]MBA9002848.1 transcriptional regulator with XRE-family HTH domain [Thermomonospora cellulosilytica]